MDTLEDLEDVLVGVEDEEDNQTRLSVEEGSGRLWQKMPKGRVLRRERESLRKRKLGRKEGRRKRRREERGTAIMREVLTKPPTPPLATAAQVLLTIR